MKLTFLTIFLLYCGNISAQSVQGTNTGTSHQQPAPNGQTTSTTVDAFDTNPLNGINTYDLVLISRHILRIEPLGTPYKLISADVNQSGTITTYDIQLIRKLILGINTEFPNKRTWRFIDKSQVFTNPANPFGNIIREINASDLPASNVDFIGCKIGDVDLTAVPNQRPSQRPVTTLAFPVPVAKSGQTITVPVTYTGTEPLDGLQFALRFDPAQWQFIAPSVGTIQGLSAGNFGLQQVNEGVIRFSWNIMGIDIPQVQAGDVLFNLTFQVTNANAENSNGLTIDDTVMPEGGWNAAGTAYQLVAESESQQRTAGVAVAKNTVTVTPNPTLGVSTIHFTAAKQGKTRVVLADAFGNQLTLRDVPTTAGQQEIVLTELEKQPAGVYIWWMKLPDGAIEQGRVVKQ